MRMRHQVAVGLGIAALFGSAVGVLAPQAAAQELAPGVSCDGFTCRNDTDDTYRVEGVGQCTDFGQRRITGQVVVRQRVRPHSTENISVSCTSPGDMWRDPIWIDYRSAVVDNSRPPTGSAG